MAWKRLNNEGEESHGNFMKWEKAGQEMEGIWDGVQEGKFGDLGSIDGIKFPLHTVLARALTELSEGAKVRILYKGMKTGKSGRNFKDFDVFIDE